MEANGFSLLPSLVSSLPLLPSTKNAVSVCSITLICTRSGSPSPWPSFTRNSIITVLTVSGAVNRGVGPFSTPTPPVTSGPYTCVQV